MGGDVDLRMAESQPAGVRLSAVGGEVFTGFDVVAFKRSRSSHGPGGCFSSKIKGGGTAITLPTTGGDVYLRKAR